MKGGAVVDPDSGFIDLYSITRTKKVTTVKMFENL